MNQIMIVDDDAAVTNYLLVFLMQTERFEVTVINDSRLVPGLLAEKQFNVMLLDMDMPGVSGMEILKVVQEKKLSIPVIVLTGVADVDLAVRAMKLGAFDYLTKPVEDEQLLQVIDSAIEHSALHRSLAELPSQLKQEDLHNRDAFSALPSNNPTMIRVLHQAEHMAASDVAVFLCGERGTGKELLARAMHQASKRRERPFLAIDLSAHDQDKFPAAFFGQARLWGGVTEERPGFLEEAAGGTLFLSEAELLPFPMQVRLKRVLQEGEFYREGSTRIRTVDIRLMVASSGQSGSGETQDCFSGDFFCHLAVNSINIPPLRERIEDLPMLANLFLRQTERKLGRVFSGFDPGFLDFLASYSFPENIQELAGIVEAAAVNCRKDLIAVEDLPSIIRRKISSGEQFLFSFQPRRLDDVTKEHLNRTLAYFHGSRHQAAEALGINPDKLEELLED